MRQDHNFQIQKITTSLHCNAIVKSMVHSNYSHLFTILTVIISGSFQDRQVKFRNRIRTDVRVTFCQVIHKHSAALKSQEAGMALVDKAMIIRWRNLQHNIHAISQS